ncbi:MAG: hypothetical protein HN691_14835 [Bacteroidetes bacterium]|nr:hypothetical protein [Bacteroidota bacterium]
MDTNREGFLKWIQAKIKETEIYKVEFDQCLHCKIGNHVLLFNEGKFPRICKDDSERARTGLMLGIQDEKIIEIRFCYVFLKHDNKYVFDCRREKIKDFQNSGLSLDEAINIALQIDDLTLF